VSSIGQFNFRESLKLFYCYAREDKLYRAALEKHLGTLRRQGLIVDWHDRNINTGQEWAKEIDINLNEADIILLLISPDFIHSDYCYSKEMNRALERHENGTARVIPIILRPCDYEGAPFSGLQALPPDAAPVTGRKWRSRDEAFSLVAQGVRKVVIELYSNDWVSKGNEYFLREQYKKALDAFEQAIYFNPNNALAHVGKGQTLNEMAKDFLGDVSFEDALDSFVRAIELDPSNGDAYVGKCIGLYWTNPDSNKDLVLDAFAEAIRIGPENEDAYIAQGNALMVYKRYEDALTSYEQAISVAIIPNRDVYKSKGDVLFNLERYTEALEAYDTCVKAGLKSEELYMSIGRAFLNLGKYQEALDAYEQALAFSTDKGQVYLERGDAFFQLKEHVEALDAYEKATNHIPNYAKFTLAQAYRGKGKVWQLLSQEAYEKAEKLDAGLPF
jgi:tetratricopeptide (TPR) repeat protein